MKANTPELMKFKKLQRKLGESRRGTIGLLEGLWIEVARNSPAGDIGRFTNEEIAIMVDWDGDPDLLVDSLVECRWLDECSENRLVVHDWKDHCPTYVKGGLAKQRKDIAIACTTEHIPIGTNKTEFQASPEVPSTKLSLAKPSEAKLSEAIPSLKPQAADIVKCPPSVNEGTWNDWLAVRKRKRAGPVTESAFDMLKKESIKAGVSLQDAVFTCAGKNWINYDSTWVAGKSQQKTFAQISEENTKKAISKFTETINAIERQ